MVDFEQKLNLLKDVLEGKKVLSDIDSNDILRYNFLSSIINSSKKNTEQLIKAYLSSETIKAGLRKLHNQILDDHHPRQSFGPGTFEGLQGQLNCVILTKQVIEEKLRWSVPQTVKNINYNILYKYKLRCTKTCFKHLYELIMACYPEEELKPYYFKKASKIWFNDDGGMIEEVVKEAIREFVGVLTNPKDVHKYKIKHLPTWINYKMFREPLLPYETNLSYMLNACFGNSHIKAIMFVYPELNLKPYYFSNVPNKYWSGEEGLKHAKEVMQELMDILTNPRGDYRLSKEEVKEIFKFKTYGKPILPYKKNLRGMLQIIFKNSPSAPFELLLESEE